MQYHIATRRPNRWPCNLSLSLILLLVLVVSGTEAIVKQQQQQQPSQQQQPQQAQQVQPQQQQRSDDSQQAQATTNGQQVAQQHQSSSSAYNNHKSASSLSSSAVPNSSQQQSYSSSVSISSAGVPSNGNIGGSVQQQAGPNVLPQSQVNAANQQQQQSAAAANYANYGPQSAANQASLGPKSYLDSMSAAASNPDQSYQAAASSVNMALANSGIFGSNSATFNSPSSQSGVQQQQSGVSPQSLNPLHYFYYPAKENQGPASGAGIQAKAGQQQQLTDMLSNSASNNYQSLAYPSYSDQLNSALSSMGSGPEPAGSSQDPSYLPQPGSGLGDNVPQGSLYNNGPQQQSNQQPQQQSQQAQQNGPHQGYNGDLSGYNSNLQPQSAPAPQNAGVSFNGPSSNGQDYLNSHQQQQQQQQQQQPQQVSPLSAYQNNLYNQMGDLSTSNFGNNAGGLASVASYMSPGQQDHTGQSGHDLFNAASLLGSSGQQFNSAASQLSPSAVSPPGNQQQQQQQQQANQNANPLSSSSLFNAASSLFGGNSQQASNAAAAANSLFSNQQYLNSFLSPQQYSQFTGQQQPSQLNDQISASASSPATAVASGSSSSGKRFGISSFIMPLLAVAGLSLLIPTMSNIGTAVGRRKRSIEDRASSSSRQQQIAFEPLNGASQLAKEMSIGEYMDKIERYYSIYKNAVENDDCLNRLICEFGSAVKDVTGKSAVVTVIEKLVPTWMTGKVHLFKEAALDHKEGREKCKKYVCHSNKQH